MIVYTMILIVLLDGKPVSYDGGTYKEHKVCMEFGKDVAELLSAKGHQVLLGKCVRGIEL